MAGEYSTTYGNSNALVIGINAYQDPRFTPLGEAEADAQSFAAVLAGPPYNFTVRKLLGKQASRDSILKELFNLRSTGADDRVVVYFAGHGYTLVDNFGAETGYLACADTVPEQDFTALELQEVTDLRRQAKAKHITFIFDACFSGQALGLTRAASVSSDKFLIRRAYQVLSAGAGDQTVSDVHSMTDTIVELLSSDVTDPQGMFTANDLGLYVQQRMAADSKQMQIPQFGHLQGSQGGDLIFRQAVGTLLPQELATALAASSSYIRIGAVGDLAGLARGDDPDLAQRARDQLQRLSQSDPDAPVRAAAQTALFRLGSALPPSPAAADAQPKLGLLSHLSTVSLKIWVGAAVAAVTVAGIVLLAVFRPGQQVAEVTETPTAALIEVATGEPSVESPSETPATSPSGEATEATQSAGATPAATQHATPKLPSASAVLLAVPYLSQLSPTAGFSDNDAGPISLSMLLAAEGQHVTTDELYQTPVLKGNKGLIGMDELQSVAKSYGLSLEVKTIEDTDPLATLKEWIDAGRPPIMLVNYQPLVAAGLNPLPTSGRYGHFVIGVGYDDQNIYLHDPYAHGSDGAYLPVPRDVLTAAWVGGYDSASGNTYKGWALVPASRIAQRARTASQLASEFDSPVGTREQRASDTIWPEGWVEINGYGSYPPIVPPTYNTGVDLGMASNAAKDQPVYAAAGGVVTFAGTTSAGVVTIVIRHDPLPDTAEVFWTRYAGLAAVLVKEGDGVTRGQQIATIGQISGQSDAYLHFDVARAGVLEADPAYTTASLDDVYAIFIDPHTFIKAHH